MTMRLTSYDTILHDEMGMDGMDCDWFDVESTAGSWFS